MMSDSASDTNLYRLVSEDANPRTKDLDLLSTEEMLKVINDEDSRVSQAVREVIPSIAEAVDRISLRLVSGGRLYYFGAGTSGRLGVLDASECPPTFGVDPTLVWGHIAGGDTALRTAVEGAEDSQALGRSDIHSLGVSSGDAVVAIAASGRTPYAIGVLMEAGVIGALTVALVCNRPTAMHDLADIVIDPVTGEEVISGSTRMKAGTAQKMVLNMISTAVMVKLGRTYGNLMVGVRATNDKLKARAARLVTAVTGESDPVAVLESCEWDVRVACVMLKKAVSSEEAVQILESAGWSLRKALGEA